MVHDNAVARTIDCTWFCDASVSSDAAVNFSIFSMNLAYYTSLLLMPIIDDDGKCSTLQSMRIIRRMEEISPFPTQMHYLIE